ncbi:MAG: CopG family transcriptional regulator [Anaerolineales bacterium]|nr:CopG family transcriptional regulator [Anaerolineales bacterium]
MADTEKITINMSPVDLGKIDLLVQEGLYTNRTDFIRTAIRNQITTHDFELQQSVTRHSFGIGIFSYNRVSFEKAKAAGNKIKVSAIGVLDLAKDIPPELADEVVESIWVLGTLNASPEVKAVLADRIKK